MPRDFGEQPREEEQKNKIEQEDLPTSKNLQRLMHNLELAERPGPDWNEKNRQETIKKIQKEIEMEKGREQREAERRRFIVESFGQEILDQTEEIAEDMGSVIVRHLLTAKNEKEAEKILSLWRDFEEAISFEADPRGRPGKVKKALEDAYDSIRQDKIGKR